jgi:hypothetical protein
MKIKGLLEGTTVQKLPSSFEVSKLQNISPWSTTQLRTLAGAFHLKDNNVASWWIAAYHMPEVWANPGVITFAIKVIFVEHQSTGAPKLLRNDIAEKTARFVQIGSTKPGIDLTKRFQPYMDKIMQIAAQIDNDLKDKLFETFEKAAVMLIRSYSLHIVDLEDVEE